MRYIIGRDAECDLTIDVDTVSSNIYILSVKVEIGISSIQLYKWNIHKWD